MNDRYQLFANCIPVQGAKHSILCDLQRQSYVRIPNDLYTILRDHRGKSVSEIKRFYEHRYDAVIDEYFAILRKHEFVFPTEHPELFPAMDLSWDTPFEVFNAIIDRDEHSRYDLHPVIQQLSDLHCKFLQLRFYHPVALEELESILQFCDRIAANIIGLEMVFPYLAEAPKTAYAELVQKYDRLNAVTVHGTPGDYELQPLATSQYVMFIPESIDSETHCGQVSRALFAVNTKTFAEAQSHNTCLNGKISVDRRGQIKNCPSLAEAFGHVDSTALASAVQQAGFKKLWRVHKDQVAVCRDCEFRYICTDCRAYTQDAGPEAYGKPLKCGYDPYSGVWSDPPAVPSATYATSEVPV